MRTPGASVVSVLWDFVGKGRQAVHHVSSPRSKTTYGWFPPVRLQTGSPAALCGPAFRPAVCADAMLPQGACQEK